MKNLLVTGARGFIGRHVARYFASQGWHVSGVGRGSWDAGEQRKWGVSDWNSSEITVETLASHPRTPDVVVHCAGGGSVAGSYASPYRDILDNVLSLANVLEYLHLRRPDAKLVFISSAAVYGDTGAGPLSEALPARPISPYGVHKQIAEELCRSYAGHFGLSCCIARLFSVYGVGLKKQLLWDACRKITSGDLTFHGTGEELRDWIHAEDAARLVYLLADRASRECPVVNGGTGVGSRVKDVLAPLARALGSSETPRFLNAAQTGHPVSFVADMRKAAAFGFVPERTLSEELRNYAAWYTSAIEAAPNTLRRAAK